MNHGIYPTLGRVIRGTSAIEVVYAVREYLDTGDNTTRYVDCVNPDTGSQWARCTVANPTGIPIGAPSEAFSPGARPWADYPKVVIGHRAAGQSPIVLMPFTNTALQYSTTAPSTPSAPPTPRDYVIANGGTKITVRDDGVLVITANGPVHVLLNGQPFSVSEGGDDDGRVALAEPLVTKLNEIITALNLLVTSLRAIPPNPTTGAVPHAGLQAALQAVTAVTNAVEETIQSDMFRLPSTTGV